jgi:hypothetical protein
MIVHILSFTLIGAWQNIRLLLLVDWRFENQSPESEPNTRSMTGEMVSYSMQIRSNPTEGDNEER